MEPDLQLTFKCLDDNTVQRASNLLVEMLRTLEDKRGLDLRRMHRIVVAADYAAELAELTLPHKGHPVTPTNLYYAVGVAMTLILPTDSGIEIVPIFDARIAAAMVVESEKYQPDAIYGMINHLLHHEFCHVHDANQHIDLMEGYADRRYEGKNRVTRPLAELCWSEYLANRMSATSAPQHSLNTAAENLAGAIKRTKNLVDGEILAYRVHGDLSRLLAHFRDHGHFLLKAAAYAYGYMDGLSLSLKEIGGLAADELSGSYFKGIFDLLGQALRMMFERYPKEWKNLNAYDDLTIVVEQYYSLMGFEWETTPDREAYVRIPFRPETMPDF